MHRQIGELEEKERMGRGREEIDMGGKQGSM